MNNFDNYGLDEKRFKGVEGTFTHIDYPNIKFMKSGFLKEWIDNYLGDDIKVIMDIGSLEGGDSLRFNSWYPNALTYSIEGSPNNFEVINKKLGQRNNLKTFNYVMSDVDGLVNFYGLSYKDFEHDGTMIMGSIYQYIDSHGASHTKRENPIQVQSITFDNFCVMNDIKEVDVAHIDIEGATYNLILGMNKVFPKLIYTEQEAIEYFKDKKIGGNENLFKLLNSKGYELIANLGHDFLFIHKS